MEHFTATPGSLPVLHNSTESSIFSFASWLSPPHNTSSVESHLQSLKSQEEGLFYYSLPEKGQNRMAGGKRQMVSVLPASDTVGVNM